MLVKRDPFAREEIHRRSEGTSQTCHWCGQSRPGGRLFKYWVESDSGRKSYIRGCSAALAACVATTERIRS